MHRNRAILWLVALLLGFAVVVTSAGSVANDSVAATVTHTAAVKPVRRAPVLSVRKRRRLALAATVVKPAPLVYHNAVDQKEITDEHKRATSKTLALLPSGCSNNLKNFSVLYSNATRRGLGGKTTIILDGSVALSEFVALLTHECGHVIHGNLLGSAASDESAFRDGGDVFYSDSAMVSFWQISWETETTKKSGAKNSDFISGYAKSDAFEDFSETFAAYVLQRDMFAARAKENTAIAAKLAWMEKNLPAKDDTLGNGTASWDGIVPWDITRLPFTLSTSL